MANLQFERAEIYSDSGYTTLLGGIDDIRTEEMPVTKDPIQVQVNNNQTINEAHSGELMLYSLRDTYSGGSLDGTAIIGSSATPTNPVRGDGSKGGFAYVKLVGRPGSRDINCGRMNLSGMESIAEGRVETLISGSLAEIDQADIMASAPATGT